MNALTPRQTEVTRLASQGLGCKEIAASIGITVNTARVTIQQARERVGAKTVAHLIAIAISRGWIAPLALALMLADLHSMSLRARQPVRTRQQVTASYRTARRDLEVLA